MSKQTNNVSYRERLRQSKAAPEVRDNTPLELPTGIPAGDPLKDLVRQTIQASLQQLFAMPEARLDEATALEDFDDETGDELGISVHQVEEAIRGNEVDTDGGTLYVDDSGGFRFRAKQPDSAEPNVIAAGDVDNTSTPGGDLETGDVDNTSTPG